MESSPLWDQASVAKFQPRLTLGCAGSDKRNKESAKIEFFVINQRHARQRARIFRQEFRKSAIWLNDHKWRKLPSVHLHLFVLQSAQVRAGWFVAIRQRNRPAC